MNARNKAFTIIEIMTVVTIMAILIGILLPAIATVRKMVRETEQKAQLNTLGLAILAFKGDYGDYPPSSAKAPANLDYSGAQKLTEALVGYDLMGFHPDSEWESDGETEAGVQVYPDPLNLTNPVHEKNLQDRWGPYLEDPTKNVFRLGHLSAAEQGIFKDYDDLAPDTYVLCDVFPKRKLALDNGSITRAGTPILYYKANTSSKDHWTSSQYTDRIYSVYDNSRLVDLGPVTQDGGPSTEEHPLNENEDVFYEYIKDDKVPHPWPYRPDSYLLISAGADGKYGTPDDITNFK